VEYEPDLDGAQHLHFDVVGDRNEGDGCTVIVRTD
jgi:hypothetical protein